MADHPILFSAPMIRALLAGRKTQTRRIVSPRNLKFFNAETGRLAASPALIEAAFCDAHSFRQHDKAGGWNWQARVFDHQPGPWTRWQARSTIQAGDRLWCRETWAVGNIYDGMTAAEINPNRTPLYCGIRYAATQERIGIKDRPSIHMPRWASRLTLIVRTVRLQRLQDITEADALDEGVRFDEAYDGYTIENGTFYSPCPIGCYRLLWNHINGDTGPKSWDFNPWVLAYSFRVRRGNIDTLGAECAKS